MLPYCKDYEDAKLFTELNLRRKRNNLIARRIRMRRKAGLQDFTHFVTFTYSYQYITRVFFEVTKTQLHDFFIQTKIKTAKHLPETSGQTVTEIGYILNYSCTHTFTRMFKKYTGITPKQYQLKCSEEKAQEPLPETKEDK